MRAWKSSWLLLIQYWIKIVILLIFWIPIHSTYYIPSYVNNLLKNREENAHLESWQEFQPEKLHHLYLLVLFCQSKLNRDHFLIKHYPTLKTRYLLKKIIKFQLFWGQITGDYSQFFENFHRNSDWKISRLRLISNEKNYHYNNSAFTVRPHSTLSSYPRQT